jgi:hypothetical protein
MTGPRELVHLDQPFGSSQSKLPVPRSVTTRRCARHVLRRLIIDRTAISAIVAELGVSWHTVNSIAMTATAELVGAAGIGWSNRSNAPRVPKPRRLHPTDTISLHPQTASRNPDQMLIARTKSKNSLAGDRPQIRRKQ